MHQRFPPACSGDAFAAYNALRNGAEMVALVLGGLLIAAISARWTPSSPGETCARRPDRARRLPADAQHLDEIVPWRKPLRESEAEKEGFEPSRQGFPHLLP